MELLLKLTHVTAVKNIKAALDKMAIYDLVHLDRIDSHPDGYTHVLFTNTWHSKDLEQLGFYVYEIDSHAIIKLYNQSLKNPPRSIELSSQGHDDEPLFKAAFLDFYGTTYETFIMDKIRFKEKYTRFIATNIVATNENKIGSTLLLVLKTIGVVNVSFIDDVNVNIEFFKLKSKKDHIITAMVMLLGLDVVEFNTKFAQRDIDLLDNDLIDFLSNSELLVDMHDCLDLSDLFYELAITSTTSEQDAVGLAGFFCDKPAGKVIAYATKSNLYNNKPIFVTSKVLSKNKYAYKTETAELLRDFYKNKVDKLYIKHAMLALIVKYHENLTKAIYDDTISN